MCHGYWSRWERRFEEREERPITFVSDPEEEREPEVPVAEEPRDDEVELEKVPAGVAD